LLLHSDVDALNLRGSVSSRRAERVRRRRL